MDPATIGKIISTGYSVAKGLYEVADGIGTAGFEVRVYAQEIDAFAKLLNQTKTELDRNQGISADLESLVEDVTELCDKVLAPLEKIKDSLKALLIKFRASPNKLRQFGQRIQWYFSSKDKLLFYRQALLGQHRILDTALGLIILQATRSGSSQNTYILQISVENSIAALDYVPREALHGFNRIDAPHLLALPNASDSTGLTQDANTHSVRDTSNDDAVVGNPQDPSSGYSVSNALVRRDPDKADPSEDLDDLEVQDIDRRMEDDLEPEADESIEDLGVETRALQLKVAKVAKKALRNHGDPSINGRGERRRSGISTSTATTRPEDQAEQTALGQLVTTTMPGDSVAVPTAPSGSIDENNVVIGIPDGTKFALPLFQVRNREALRESLYRVLSSSADTTALFMKTSAFAEYGRVSGNNLIDWYLEQGYFILLGPNEVRILPSVWEELVKPGLSVKFIWAGKAAGMNPVGYDAKTRTDNGPERKDFWRRRFKRSDK